MELKVQNRDEPVVTPKDNEAIETRFTTAEDMAEEEYEKKSLGEKVGWGLFYTIAALSSLYFFLVAIKFIGEGFTLALGCNTKGAFDFASNPIAGLMVGTIATALLHSSSTVTSITVALVGAGGMTIRQGVYIVMGANIGTCVTCIMVAFGQVGDAAQFQRAMAAATVHDMYNIWSVFVMFPLEVLFHPLEELSKAMSNAKTSGGDFKSPIDLVLKPLTDYFITLDKTGINNIAMGKKQCVPGTSFIKGGVFKGTSMSDGSVAAIFICIGFVVLVCALLSLVKMLGKLFLGATKKVVARALNYNGYVNIVAGTLVTFAVHSSTVVTSTLTPLAGLGVITLEQVYPLVIGANLGTTATALLASLATGKADSVAIALVHFWFNVFGIILFYPIPITRKPILGWARSLAFWSVSWPFAAVVFLLVLFIIAPGALMGVVYMCTADSTVAQVFGWLIAALCALLSAGLVFWYLKKGGRETWYGFLERKRNAREARAREQKISVAGESPA
ncbi:hypothetical protein PybrP1_000016 [[Pythium] brassicae (nom. inval.)]|nr:hypothetical protein PybrP1_000016 [[Pythium] brassicae (nom. inval.)]